jgi:hypothetical protein
MLFKLVGQLLRHTLTRQSANDQPFGVYTRLDVSFPLADFSSLPR